MSDSLVDTAYKNVVDLWVVFSDLDDAKMPITRSRFWYWLKPGFRHVEVWKFIPTGAWIRFDTGIEMIDMEVYADPPWVLKAHLNTTAVRVQRLVDRGSFRERFFFGPITCVELSKAFLGISNMFVRTPYQLFKFLKANKSW